MAVRQHLYALQREHLVTAEERPVPLGRPAKYWQLTNEADRLFPDAYAELNVALIDAMDQALGPAGVQRVLASRGEKQRKYESEHKYDLEKFGLTEEQVRRDCAFFYDTFLPPLSLEKAV